MQHNRDLQFEQQPDYEYLQGILKHLAIKEGIDLDEKTFDWVTKSSTPLKELSSFKIEDDFDSKVEEKEEQKSEPKSPKEF